MKQYISRAEAMKELGVTESGLKKIVSEIRAFSGIGRRYGQYAIRGSGKLLQIRYAVLTDYMSYRDRLSNKDTRKYVPDFDIREAERDLGVTSDVFITQQLSVDPDLIADAIIRGMVSKMSAG